MILLVAAAYFVFDKFGVFSKVVVGPSTLPPVFFFFGLVAGFSTCAATVSGFVLSYSSRRRPLLLFFLGRIFSFLFFGMILGLVGQFIHLSFEIYSFLNVIVTIVLALIGFSLLGFSFPLPRLLKTNSSSPFLLGILTFFIPCGFTLTAQTLALAASDPLVSAQILGYFVIGTTIPLILLSLVGKALLKTKVISQIIGVLIIIFALKSLSSQFGFGAAVLSVNDQPTNLIRMTATSTGYFPNHFVIKAGDKIRWEIDDKGTSGCTNAIISRTLFDGPIYLVPGTTSVKEFAAPATPGTYRFSCWMGMISGTITVVN